MKDCRFCASKDNCTTCNNNYVPSDGGTSCSPPIFTVPPTREPGSGRGLNTGAIIGKEDLSCIDSIDYTYLEKIMAPRETFKIPDNLICIKYSNTSKAKMGCTCNSLSLF